MREPWEHEWKDYYGLLGLDPSAEAEVVAGAYKALARKYHPDKSPDPQGRKMKLLNEAYEVLSDPERRSWYDREYRQRERQEATDAEEEEARAEQAAREEAERQRAAEEARRREEAETEAEAAHRRKEEAHRRQAEEEQRRETEEEKRRVAAKRNPADVLSICLLVGVLGFIVLCILLSGGRKDERPQNVAETSDKKQSPVPAPGEAKPVVTRPNADDELDAWLAAHAPSTKSRPTGGGAGTQSAEITNSIGMRLRRIQAGSFVMGSNGWNEQPSHGVTIAKPFYMGIYHVTQGQYRDVMRANPSRFKGENLPAESVTWHEAVAFCRALSQMEGSAYRLPTEAEWEYASRAGSSTAYFFGDDPGLLTEYGWYHANSNGQTHEVGLLRPNAWGLYDMHGNVWQWCASPYSKTYDGSEQKGAEWDTGMRVLRGGSWHSGPEYCRSAHRLMDAPGERFDVRGFRVVRSVKTSE